MTSDACSYVVARRHEYGTAAFARRQVNNEIEVVLKFIKRSALRYRATKQVCRGRRRKLGIYAIPARGLTEYRHLIRIAAKACDILAYPLERKLLIHQPIVTGRMTF